MMLSQNEIRIRAAKFAEDWKDSTMVDLYDPTTIPPDLKKAHFSLDCAVDKLYRKKPFQSDHERIECLLEMYGNMLK